MIPTHKHLDYALGYIGLNLLTDAGRELALIPADDQAKPEVIALHIELAMAKNAWTRVITLASKVTTAVPTMERPWIAWAFALREKHRVAEARDVLLRAERALPEPSALVDYNLACYFCLLDDRTEARRRLKRACAREPEWKTEAADDPDLAALHQTTPNK